MDVTKVTEKVRHKVEKYDQEGMRHPREEDQ